MVAEQIHQRLLRDPLPHQLGALAADLARISSFSDNPANHDAVASLLEEGKFFAEWIAPAAPPDTQTVLAEVQHSLACWERAWHRGESVPAMRDEAVRLSNVLLEMAGFVKA